MAISRQDSEALITLFHRQREKRSCVWRAHFVQVGKSLLMSAMLEMWELRLSTPGCVTRHWPKRHYRWWSGYHSRGQPEGCVTKALEIIGVVGWPWPAAKPPSLTNPLWNFPCSGQIHFHYGIYTLPPEHLIFRDYFKESLYFFADKWSLSE